MKCTARSIWHPTGFAIRAMGYRGLFRFGFLNPEVESQQHFTRIERLRIGVWFIRQAFRWGW